MFAPSAETIFWLSHDLLEAGQVLFEEPSSARQACVLLRHAGLRVRVVPPRPGGAWRVESAAPAVHDLRIVA